jgi:hypothetical protein
MPTPKPRFFNPKSNCQHLSVMASSQRCKVSHLSLFSIHNKDQRVGLDDERGDVVGGPPFDRNTRFDHGHGSHCLKRPWGSHRRRGCLLQKGTIVDYDGGRGGPPPLWRHNPPRSILDVTFAAFSFAFPSPSASTMADFSSVINSIPPVTRSLLLAVAVITA